MVKREQARVAEEGQMGLLGRRDGRSWGVEGHEVVVGRVVSVSSPLCQKQQAGLLIFK